MTCGRVVGGAGGRTSVRRPKHDAARRGRRSIRCRSSRTVADDELGRRQTDVGRDQARPRAPRVSRARRRDRRPGPRAAVSRRRGVSIAAGDVAEPLADLPRSLGEAGREADRRTTPRSAHSRRRLSSRCGRTISSPTASRGCLRPASTSSICVAIGQLDAQRAPSASAAVVVRTPSATIRMPREDLVERSAPAELEADVTVAAERRRCTSGPDRQGRSSPRASRAARPSRRRQPRDLGEAARDERRQRVVAELHGLGDARGDGDDVLQRRANLDADDVVRSVEAKRRARETPPGPNRTASASAEPRPAPSADAARLPTAKLGPDSTTTGWAPLRLVANHLRHPLQRVVLEPLGRADEHRVGRNVRRRARGRPRASRARARRRSRDARRPARRRAPPSAAQRRETAGPEDRSGSRAAGSCRRAGRASRPQSVDLVADAAEMNRERRAPTARAEDRGSASHVGSRMLPNILRRGEHRVLQRARIAAPVPTGRSRRASTRSTCQRRGGHTGTVSHARAADRGCAGARDRARGPASRAARTGANRPAMPSAVEPLSRQRVACTGRRRRPASATATATRGGAGARKRADGRRTDVGDGDGERHSSADPTRE